MRAERVSDELDEVLGELRGGHVDVGDELSIRARFDVFRVADGLFDYPPGDRVHAP